MFKDWGRVMGWIKSIIIKWKIRHCNKQRDGWEKVRERTSNKVVLDYDKNVNKFKLMAGDRCIFIKSVSTYFTY